MSRFKLGMSHCILETARPGLQWSVASLHRLVPSLQWLVPSLKRSIPSLWRAVQPCNEPLQAWIEGLSLRAPEGLLETPHRVAAAADVDGVRRLEAEAGAEFDQHVV